MHRSGNKLTTSKKQPLTPGLSVQSTWEFEEWVVTHANYFTLIYRIGPGRVQREEFNSLAEAIAVRDDNPRGMIYAVMNVGRSVMIGPTQYRHMLEVRDALGMPRLP